MIRFLLPMTLIGTPVAAHVGHIGELAGHGHWVAGIALGAALGVSLWGALKGKKSEQTEADEPAEEEETA